MSYLMITSHPYEGSFNAGAAKAVKETLTEKGHAIRHIDLIADGFDPVMRSEDLRLWGKGESCDPLVPTYQKAVKDADILIFPFPVWWGAMPAVLKGFCEKILLPGWAYRYGEKGEMIGLLNGKKAIVISTMETELAYFNQYFNNPIEGAFIKDTLQVCGIEIQKWFQIDHIVSGGRGHAENQLKQIIEYIKQQ